MIAVLEAIGRKKLRPGDCLIKLHIVHGIPGEWNYDNSVIDDLQLKSLKQSIADINSRRVAAGLVQDRFVQIIESH